MLVNYATDPLGKHSYDLRLDAPEVDETPYRFEGVSFATSVVCLHRSELLGTIRLVITWVDGSIVTTFFAVTEPPLGRGITPALLERAAHELPGIVPNVVFRYRLRFKWEGEPVDLDRLMEVVRHGMMPNRKSGESASEFVYRMWKHQYEPYGLTQKDLARDLGRSHGLVREYVSKESRREANEPRTIAEAVNRKRVARKNSRSRKEST